MSKLMKQSVNEGLLKDELPSDINYAIYQNRTSIGNNPAIPDIYGVPFLYTVVKKEFEDAKEKLHEIGVIDDVEGKGLKEAQSKLIKLCQELERPYRNQLEKICFDHVVDIFGVPSDSLEINVQLKDNVEIDSNVIKLNPLDNDDTVELSNVTDAMSVKKEVFKRRVLDALAMGAGLSISRNIENYKEDIAKVNPKLVDLYNKILCLNTYLLFEKNELGLTDKNNMQLGTVEVMLGKEDEMVRISAQGAIFPILLSETIRGFMELFMAHGLPKKKERAMAVLDKSDYLNAEPWDMRIGPGLWELFEKSLNDVVLEEMPYLFKRISCLEPKKFNFLMKEVFAKTRKGKEIMSLLCNKAKHDIEYDKFADKMDKLNKDKGVITDEFIHADEL